MTVDHNKMKKTTVFFENHYKIEGNFSWLSGVDPESVSGFSLDPDPV